MEENKSEIRNKQHHSNGACQLTGRALQKVEKECLLIFTCQGKKWR